MKQGATNEGGGRSCLLPCHWSAPGHQVQDIKLIKGRNMNDRKGDN